MTAPLGEGIEALSRLVAGNDHLTTEPGLVYAMQTANVTEQQAGAINQFVGGLNAEQAVRAATAAGAKIGLSDSEQATLSAMGVDYSGVLHTPQPPVADLRTKMAAEGKQPVVDANGKVVTDKQGNPKTEPLKQDVLGQGVLSALGNAASLVEGNGSFGQELGSAVSDVKHAVGTVLSSGQDPSMKKANSPGLSAAVSAGYNTVSSFASQAHEMSNRDGLGPVRAAHASEQEKALATRLGYDPSSTVSMLAFRAKGYAFNDASSASAWWDEKNPNGAFGLSGDQAVTEAQVFLDDPAKYTQSIIGDKSLTPQQTSDKLAFASSPEFTELQHRVAASRQSIGTDVADSVGVDPVKHPSAFKIVSTAADVAASFVADPLAAGLSAYTKVQRASVAIRNFDDAGNISKILKAETPTRAQSKAQQVVHDMVALGNQYRAAKAAGSDAELARVQAQAGTNPLGGLLADFTGHDMLTDEKLSSEDVLARAAKGESVHSPYATGKGEPVDTYDKAVEYLSSKAALFRLGGGKAPVEFSTMPGALSSLGFSRLKGELMAWSAGRSVAAGDKAVAKVLSRAEADPGYAKTLVDDKLLKHLMPQSDDAVDFLTGKVLAARRDAEAGVEGGAAALESAKRALADRKATLEANAPLGITDAGRGMVRGNKLRYGTAVAPESTLGKVASIYTLGTAQRARQVVTRVSNWLPRDLTIDINSAAGAEDVRRVARTYLTPGDSQLLAARWTAGTADTRRAIIAGLHDQIEHAAGLTRTAAGQAMRAERGGKLEAYSSVGREWVDPAGRNAAQFPGQVETVFKLPNFGKIQKASAKIGLYEATMGRAMQTKPVESMMAMWRLLVLGVPVTAMRAITESFLNAGAKGMLGDTVKAKTVLRASQRLDAAGIRRTAIANAVAGTVGFRDVGRLYRWAVGRKVDPEFQKAIESMPADLFEARLLNQSRYHYAQEVDPGGVGDATAIAHLGLNPKKTVHDTQQAFDVALRQKAGYELTDEVDGLAGANAFAMTLGTRANIAPHVFKAILDRIESPTQIVHSPEVKGILRDTRGEGVQFHGATGPVELRSGGYYNDKNIYGGSDGFYTTDAVDIAKGYGRGSSSAKVYRVTEKQPVKFYDMERELSVAQMRKLFKTEGRSDELSVFADDAIKAAARDGKVSLRRAMDEIRNNSSSAGHGTHAVQEIFDEALYSLRDQGFGGMRHIGGGITDSKAHQVKIYFDPHGQVKLAEHTPKWEVEPKAASSVEAGYSIDHVVQALETGEAQRLMHHTLYGKVFLDEGGAQQRALSEADVALGKEQWAQNLVDDVAQLMTGRNGVYQDKLAGFIRQHGHAPDAEWITENIKKQNRPAAMIRPVWNAVVPGMDEKAGFWHNAGKLVDAVNETSGKVYQWAVERLIQRHSTGPLYAAAYGKSKVALEPYKQRLISEGFTDDAAERITADIAAQQGWNHVALMVDDPALRSQMDVVGRSFFAFSRATTAMIRRWGTTFYHNPAAARRFQLAAEGAVHSGLVYKDQNGDWMMAIPYSGVAQEVLFHAMSHIPGLAELAKFPVADFTGRVASIVPGSDNPTQYATTPLISIVGRTVAGLFPNHREIFDEIDAKMNGTSGQGQGVIDTLLPRLFKMAKDADLPGVDPAMGGDARNSVLTSSMVGALYNLYAAGKVPPDGASPAQQQEFLDNLKTQTRSNLFTRFLLGTISPMTISTPSDNGQLAPDSAFAARGVQSLKDEYKTILNDTGGDLARANAIWANLHPEATVYEDSSTTLNVKGADIPPTQKAYQWLASNGDLIHKYGSLAAYFVPQDQGAFNMAAYRAELEQGFRQRKTPQEFLDGARIASAGSVYYAAENDMNNELAKAIAANDTTKASAIRAGWSAWAKQFKGQHPTFAEHLVSFATSGSDADMQFRNLQQMVKDGDIPGGKPAKTAVESMVSNFNQYRAFVARYPKTTDADNQAKAWAKSNLQHIFDQIITAHPDLTDLYNGVFRPLERSLTYVQPNTTGGGGA